MRLFSRSDDHALQEAMNTASPSVVMFSRRATIDVSEVGAFVGWTVDGRPQQLTIVRTPVAAFLGHVITGLQASSMMFGGDQRGARERWARPDVSVRIVARTLPMRRWLGEEAEAWLRGSTVVHDE